MRGIQRTATMSAAAALALVGLVGCDSAPLGPQGFEAQEQRRAEAVVEPLQRADEVEKERRATIANLDLE